MNGADPPDSNRFRLLDPDLSLPKKRIKVNDFVPLPEIKQNDDHIPCFLIASATGPTIEEKIRPLSSYNVFQIERGLKHICADSIVVTELRSGDLLIKTTNAKAADRFMKATHIGIRPVKITSHKGLNTIQGRIYSKNLIDISEKELTEELSSQKVVEVRKVMRKSGDRLVPTGAAILTFDLIRRPDIIKLGWDRVRVQEYIPNPMRCRNCQRLGHTKNRCRNTELCKECANTTPHETWQRTFCINCEIEAHPSYDPSCPTFLKHKSVNKIKIDRRCTIRDAWKIFNSNPAAFQIQPFKKNINTPSMAQIVKNNKPATNEIDRNNKEDNNAQNSTTKKPNKYQEKYISNGTSNKQKQNTYTSNKEFLQKNVEETTPKRKQPSKPTNTDTTILASTSNSATTTNGTPTGNFTHSTTNETETSPYSQLYKKFPDLNVLITPKTFTHTCPQRNIPSEPEETDITDYDLHLS
ncbi:PREDICTED: uncharacterized protein LOC108359128 [Rhagoletis zephyria]|uniref:uncharacterized protein LOC108359128 n=1 Tax=Rhagoletis zephyria TaxID=28612 RepID=UPI0008114804|nr:PREDICTED: uncharacterized protein LOC108359128 [Rhagoletis zephyria]